MYKYTPKQQVLRDLQVVKTGKWWDKEFFKRQEVLRQHNVEPEYIMTCVLSKHYHRVVFYSKTKVSNVPVNGYLFPVSMFNEEIV